jgi:hypothetical protein
MTDLAERVTKLERRMNDIEPLARGTGQEVAGWRGVLKNHTEVLNKFRDDLVDQRARLIRLENKVDSGFARMDEGFRQANENFATIEAKFGMVKAGMDHITNLLTPKPSDES